MPINGEAHRVSLSSEQIEAIECIRHPHSLDFELNEPMIPDGFPIADIDVGAGPIMKQLPLVFVLMAGKAGRIWHCLQDSAGPIVHCTDCITADFEVAIWQALCQVLPEVQLGVVLFSLG